MTEAAFRDMLRTFPLYDDLHRAHVRGPHLGWRLPAPNDPRGIDYGLDLQVDGDVCYLLTIGIPASTRGKGLGYRLYLLAEEVAKRLGCRTLRMTPSGWTPSGETREAYVVRRLGYRMDGEEAVKELACSPPTNASGPPNSGEPSTTSSS